MDWEIIHVDGKEGMEKYNISSILAKLLEASQLDEKSVQELLDTDDTLTTSKDPCVLQCVKRILSARQKREKIFIGGDYDADGICSTAIMKKTLDLLGIENGYYIPDRFKEGYGLAAKTVELAHQKGYDIIMTVDNGVKAQEAIQKAKELGMEIIVTDHHRIEEKVDADIVVHPDYMHERYAYLCGAGVALQISRNLIGENDDLTAMAAVAHIGDVMPLWRETRKIVKKGMRILRQGRPRSLYALLYNGAQVNETSIAFQIVPKLNSIGRMNDISNVNTVVRYLLLQNEDSINNGAMQINQVNEMRKKLSASMSEEAAGLCNDDDILIVYKETFHEGICGLAAGKLAEQLKKPVLVFAKNGETWKGSGRSIPGFDLFAFFSDFNELSAFGGHEGAVGLSVPQEQFAEFQMHVKEKSGIVELPSADRHEKAILLEPEEIGFDVIKDLEQLSPYPKEMVKPYFAIETKGCVKTYETPKVAKYAISCGNTQLDGVLYTRKDVEMIEKPNLMIGTLGINRYRNQISCQLEIEYMK